MTTVNSLLKEVYYGKINDQLNDEVVADSRMERTSDGVVDTVGGKYVTFPLRVSRNAGISYRAENTQIADPGQQGYASVQVPLKNGYARFRFTGQVMELAESNPQAFASSMTEEMDRLKDDISKDSNRITYGDPAANGALCYIADTATSATHIVNDTRNLQVGEVVDVLVNTTGAATGGIASTQATPVTIVSVNDTTKSVVFSASFGPTVAAPTAAFHAVYRAGNRNLEPSGLLQVLSTTLPLHGLDPATQPIWQANVINGTTPGTPQALTELNMITGCDLARKKAGSSGKISVIFCSLGVRRSYFSLLVGARRYNDPKTYEGGFVGLAFNYGKDIPVVEDVDAPPNKMLMITESMIKKFRKKPWAYVDADGDILKWVRDFDAWEGMMRCYWEYGTKQRNAHTLYNDITES
jgi:hypothetical protein